MACHDLAKNRVDLGGAERTAEETDQGGSVRDLESLDEKASDRA
jgi:hypothetical protein